MGGFKCKIDYLESLAVTRFSKKLIAPTYLSNPTNGATLGTQTTASLTILDNDINNATLLNPANFTLNGSAKFGIGGDGVSSFLRLTDDYWQSGSAFLTNAINLSNNASFSSYFKFQITDSQGLGDEDGAGADGLVFAIQTIANNVGSDGGGIGYLGINQSLGIEFDTFYNGEFGDINGNHVGIDINGAINSAASQPIANRLNNGNIWSAWVDYNGLSDVLEVRISETNLRPSTALLSYTVDLPSILTTNDAFIGFTSGTGSGTGDHDILDWQFNNSYNPITEIANSELDFSGVQGLNNWYYGYYDGPFNSSDFQQMTQFNTDGSGGWQVQAGTYWTGIGSMTAHGNGTNGHPGMAPIEQWAVRRWVSEANGTIQIEGHLAKTGMGGNGVIGRIFVDGVEIWSQSIDGYDSTGINYQIETVVNLNSIVDFALDPRESNDYYDTTIFTAQIKGIESDSPGILSFSSSQFSVNEDGTPITQVTLTRTGGSTGEVSAILNLTDGTATAGSDYDGTSIIVTFADGETTKTVDIPIVDDTLYEGDEILNLTLSDPTGGATLGTQQTATLNIIDNETPPPPSLLQVRLNLLKDNDGNPGDIINNDQIGLYQSFFVEILVGDFRDNAVGVNGLQLDFNWDGFILESINVPFDPANIINSQFPLLQGGTLDNPNGLIDDLSGGSLPAFELGQAIGINQLDRFALIHFYAENITNGISYLTTAVDSVSLADDASYSLDVETYQPLEVLTSYNQYNFSYHYGNGDSYTGSVYATEGTYSAGQVISIEYSNETGYEGYYTIDSISSSTFDSSYNNRVYLTSYTDSDTVYGTTTVIGEADPWWDGIHGYYGLGSEEGYAYDANGYSSDSYFSNYYEADLVAPSISITDNSGNASDASIKFTTELSKFRKNYSDSEYIRPNYADSSKYFDITNTGTGVLTVSDIQINVAGVTTDLDLTGGDLLLNPNQSQRVKLTYDAAAAKEVFNRSDALVLFTNAVNLPEFAIALSGKSTFNSDVNYDGKVGVDDLGSLNQGKANLKKGIYDPTADITGDGLFNNLDVAMLQSENKLSLFA